MSLEGPDKLLVVEEFFAQKIWFLDVGEGVRVCGASIKVEPSGYLLVLKGRSAEGPKVTFIGAGTIEGIRRKLLNSAENGGPEWRVDKFAFDRLGEI